MWLVVAERSNSLSLFLFLCPPSSSIYMALHLLVLLNRQKQLEFRGQLILRIQAIREIDPSDSAICVNLHSQCLHIICSVCSPRKIRQIELDLIPSIIQSHRHRTNKWLHPRRRLVIGGTEPSPHSLVVLHLNLECKVLLHVLYDHHQKWKLYPQCLGWWHWTRYVRRRHVCAHNLQHWWLNVAVGDSLNVPILDFLIPNL